ncbi:AprI/Inh family metalloprotease inhibitor, partial [Pseudomonas gingeri]
MKIRNKRLLLGPRNQGIARARSLLVLLVLTGDAVMASSLLLPSRESLAGQWQLSVNDGSAQICVLELCVQAPTLAGDLQCAARLLGQQPGSWEPTPDGLWLFDQEGNGLV